MIDQAGDDWITEKDIKAFAEMSGDYAMDEVRQEEGMSECVCVCVCVPWGRDYAMDEVRQEGIGLRRHG